MQIYTFGNVIKKQNFDGRSSCIWRFCKKHCIFDTYISVLWHMIWISYKCVKIHNLNVRNVFVNVPCKFEYNPSNKFDLNHLFQFQVESSRLSSKLTSGKSKVADNIWSLVSAGKTTTVSTFFLSLESVSRAPVKNNKITLKTGW